MALYWDKGHTGDLIVSPPAGGTDGWLNAPFPLRVGEYFIGGGGSIGGYVAQLYLFTNMNQTYSFGPHPAGSTDFQFTVDDPSTEEIIGFFGRSSGLIDAIGFVARKRQ